MEIIKKGNKPLEESKTCTCHKCGTELKYTKTDVQHDRDGSYIVCPVCTTFITSKL